MRKYLTLFLCFCLCIQLSACGPVDAIQGWINNSKNKQAAETLGDDANIAKSSGTQKAYDKALKAQEKFTNSQQSGFLNGLSKVPLIGGLVNKYRSNLQTSATAQVDAYNNVKMTDGVYRASKNQIKKSNSKVDSKTIIIIVVIAVILFLIILLIKKLRKRKRVKAMIAPQPAPVAAPGRTGQFDTLAYQQQQLQQMCRANNLDYNQVVDAYGNDISGISRAQTKIHYQEKHGGFDKFSDTLAQAKLDREQRQAEKKAERKERQEERKLEQKEKQEERKAEQKQKQEERKTEQKQKQEERKAEQKEREAERKAEQQQKQQERKEEQKAKEAERKAEQQAKVAERKAEQQQKQEAQKQAQAAKAAQAKADKEARIAARQSSKDVPKFNNPS